MDLGVMIMESVKYKNGIHLSGMGDYEEKKDYQWFIQGCNILQWYGCRTIMII